MKTRILILSALSFLFASNVSSQELPITPPVDFYSLSFTTVRGQKVEFKDFKGKKVLIVNTASKCGYTPQFEALEKLSEQYADKVVVVGFPSNDFGEQDPGTNAEILEFCSITYGVTFPVMEKSSVKGDSKNEVYKWLTTKNMNGWNEKEPAWNFTKYLIDAQGRLIGVFPSKVTPLSEEITSKL